MISVDEALERIISQIGELPPRTVDLMEALGCVLREDVAAADNIPPFDNSAMDGYAVRYEDLGGASKDSPVELKVLQDLAAGYVAESEVGAGEAIRIMTGAPVPEGASAVVMVERTERSDGGVKVFAEVRDGENIRRAGEDVPAGEVILTAGKTLHAGDIGMLATVGFPTVKVAPRPVVAVVATGDELIDIDRPLSPGKIRNSNTYSIASQVIEAGGVPRILGIARDTADEVTAKIKEGLQADAIITSGGVSVGDYDLVKDVLSSMGEMLFWKVAMKPAKPLAFGVISGKPLFGLPGNPSSSMVSFEQFVRPSLLKMAGKRRLSRHLVEVTVGDGVKKRPGLRYFVRVTVSSEGGGLVARLAGTQSSGALSAMTRANALLVLPEDTDAVAPGQRAMAQVLHPEEFPW